MALAGAVKDVDYSRRRRIVTVAVTFSVNYATGGDTLDLTAITNPAFKSNAKFGSVPPAEKVKFRNGAGGYDFEWVPGTTLANGKIKVFSSANTELAAGAYNAALTGDTLYVDFEVNIWNQR